MGPDPPKILIVEVVLKDRQGNLRRRGRRRARVGEHLELDVINVDGVVAIKPKLARVGLVLVKSDCVNQAQRHGVGEHVK